MVAWDLNDITVTLTDAGWTTLAEVVTSNETDHTGDLSMQPFCATTTGSTMTLAASGSGTADWAEVLITVHGVTDAIPFPYADLVAISSWPALVTEMACGAILNENWTFTSGISPWTGGNGATISASDLFTFGNSAGSLLVTPGGEFGQQAAVSEYITIPAQQPPSSVYTATYTAAYEPGGAAGEGAGPVTYDLTAQVTVPSAWDGSVQAAAYWYNSAASLISVSSTPTFTVTGSLQEISAPVTAPAAAATAQMWVWLTGGTVPTSALMYVGFASLAIPGAHGAVPDDQLNWTDLSARAFTKEPVRITRGIQYEQQSLEAGTLEIPLADNDGYLTPGNQQSPYYPYAGDDDVPIRVRAVWPNSVTPYSVLYSGFTDDVKIVLDEENLYQYAQVTAADCWSRLTAQMLTAAQQEILADIPANSTGAFWPCNDMAGASAAANLAPTPAPSLAVQNSKFGSDDLTGAFGSTAISLLGDPGGTGWSLSGLAGSGDIAKGLSLIWFPPNPASLPPIAGGVSVDLWAQFGPVVDSINWGGVIAACVGAKGPVWTLSIGAPTGGESGQILLNVYDKTTGDVTTTVVDLSDNWGGTLHLTVEFTQTTWAFYLDSASAGTGTCNFAGVYSGFSFNGLNVPYAGLSGYCFNGTVQNIAIYPLTLPQPRITAQYNVALTAELDEPDVSRLARVTAYGGFTPPLAMFGNENTGNWPDAGTDPVTQITDTIGQVVSDYFTNVASSTLAMLAVDGTGAMVYRRRTEWYDRPIGVWYLGEHAPLPLNLNPYFTSGVAHWSASQATLTWSQNGGEFYDQGAAELTATGGGAVGFAPENETAQPGQEYACVISVMAPEGYSAGVYAELVWLNSSDTTISTTTGNAVPLVAGAWTHLFVTGQAPDDTAFLAGMLATSATPSEGTVFLVSSVVLTVYPGEAPYLRDVRLSIDRAQMFNAAILTQSGTGELTTFSGTTLNFSPTSGITVTAENETSVAQRGNVPYTATVYLQNTAQNIPLAAEFSDDPPGTAFVPAEGCIEDLASWIIQTLGVPVLRGDQVVLTPAATWQAMITALQAEIGDTAILARRPIGAPPLALTSYISSLSHEINLADEESPWVTTYQVSPAPTQTILQCDSPVWGVLDSQNLLGW